MSTPRAGSGGGRVRRPRVPHPAIIVLAGLAGCAPSGGGGDGDAGGDGQDDLVFQTNEGELRVALDNQDRLSRIERNELSADFVWGGGEVEISLADGQTVSTQSAEASTTDDALLAALQQFQDDTGEDVGDVITWLEEHPGGVSKAVWPAARKPDARRATPGALPVGMQSQIDPRIEAHLDGLARPMAQAANMRNLVEAIVNDPATGLTGDQLTPWISLLDILNDLVNLLHTDFQDQQAACVNPCTPGCRVPCVAEGSGACCEPFDFEGVTGYTCSDTTEAQCDGNFNAGWSCDEIECDPPGACCLLNGICTDESSGAACDAAAALLGIGHYAFSGNTTCEELRAAGECSAGTCCYADPDRPADCDVPPGDCSAPEGQWVEGDWCLAPDEIDPCE